MQGYGVSPLETMAREAMLRGLVFIDQFTYSASFSAATNNVLGASGSAVATINIDNDSDFVMQQVNLAAFSAGPTQITTPNYLMLLTRAGSARQLMNQPQHVQTICGQYWNNAVPGYWSTPGLVQRRDTLTVQLTNNTATAALRIDVAFLGFKVYYGTIQTPGGPRTATAADIFGSAYRN